MWFQSNKDVYKGFKTIKNNIVKTSLKTHQLSPLLKNIQNNKIHIKFQNNCCQTVEYILIQKSFYLSEAEENCTPTLTHGSVLMHEGSVAE